MKATSMMLFACALCFATTGAIAQETTTQQQAKGAQKSQEYGGSGPGCPGMGWRGNYGWGDEDWDRPGPWERHRMGGGWDNPRMMGGGEYGMMAHHGMMGPGGMHRFGRMIPMIVAMMDANNDGALSLEEVQAVNARMFNFVDRNKDGKVTAEEVQMAFGVGFGGPSGNMGTGTGDGTTGGGQGTTNQ